MLTQITLKNNSHYRIQCDKSHFDIPNPNNFDVRKQRQNAYYVRNYYEFLDCQASGGFVTFYTFTFNDNALQKINGRNVLDNDAIHWLLRDSGLRKSLRSLGLTFKYFVAPEYGEGKGNRGYGNNPHYHGIFYFYPIHGAELPRVSLFLLVNDVTKLFRRFWQGNDYVASSSNDPRLFKFGKLDVSKKGALVSDFKAIRYSSKYVVKDSIAYKNINHIRSYYLKTVVPRYLHDYDESHGHCISSWLISTCGRDPLSYDSGFFKLVELVWKNNTQFRRYVMHRYYPKVFISKGFGACALRHIESDYTIQVPDTQTCWKFVELPLYLKRKLFYDVIKSPDGVPSYRLNALGGVFMRSRLQRKIDNYTLNSRNNLVRIFNFSSSVFEDFKVTFCSFYSLSSMTFDDLLSRLRSRFYDTTLLNIVKFFHPAWDFKNDLLYLRSVYNCIYKYHSYVDVSSILYPWSNDMVSPIGSVPVADDFGTFLYLHNTDYRS